MFIAVLMTIQPNNFFPVLPAYEITEILQPKAATGGVL